MSRYEHPRTLSAARWKYHRRAREASTYAEPAEGMTETRLLDARDRAGQRVKADL
ncbi:MAG: hypothetical protein ACM3XO_04155 [Bacteroidota bacterium]